MLHSASTQVSQIRIIFLNCIRKKTTNRQQHQNVENKAKINKKKKTKGNKKREKMPWGQLQCQELPYSGESRK